MLVTRLFSPHKLPKTKGLEASLHEMAFATFAYMHVTSIVLIFKNLSEFWKLGNLGKDMIIIST